MAQEGSQRSSRGPAELKTAAFRVAVALALALALALVAAAAAAAVAAVVFLYFKLLNSPQIPTCSSVPGLTPRHTSGTSWCLSLMSYLKGIPMGMVCSVCCAANACSKFSCWHQEEATLMGSLPQELQGLTGLPGPHLLQAASSWPHTTCDAHASTWPGTQT